MWRPLLATVALMLVPAAVCAQPQPAAAPVPRATSFGETARIDVPAQAHALLEAGQTARANPTGPAILGRWDYRSQLLILSSDGPFDGSFQQLTAAARARFLADGATDVSMHSVRVCHDSAAGIFLEGNVRARGNVVHTETILALGATQAFRVTYARPVKAREIQAAVDALYSLCVVSS